MLLVFHFSAFAFEWKTRSNDALRADMISLAEQIKAETQDRKLSEDLGAFISAQRAETDPCAWIDATNAFVDKWLKRYPAELSKGGECSYERCALLLLRDYPMHVDNYREDATQEIRDHYEASIHKMHRDAETSALKWLSRKFRSGNLEVCKVYNMGFIFRSQGQAIGIDLQWSGDRKQMEELVSHLDVLFVTHPHGDHYGTELLETMLDAGKPVVLPCDILPQNDSPMKIIVGNDNPYGMTVGGTDFKSMMGNQGERTPCNVYLISVGGWNIAHNGDNAVPEAEAYLSKERVDVLVSACWNGIRETSDRVKANPENSDCFWLSAHENEWRHTVDHRESYEELFRAEDRLGDSGYDYLRTIVLDAAGDRFTLK